MLPETYKITVTRSLPLKSFEYAFKSGGMENIGQFSVTDMFSGEKSSKEAFNKRFVYSNVDGEETFILSSTMPENDTSDGRFALVFGRPQ